MVNGRGEVCDACLDRHFSHATKNVCVKGSRVKSALATMEAEFLKLHHSYDKIDLIIAPSQFMKNKLDEGGFAGKTVAMQNFLTDSQMAMGARWRTRINSRIRRPEQDRTSVLRSPFQGEGHSHLGEGISAGCGARSGECQCAER